MTKAIVLLSGGIDSTVCATLAKREHGKENVIALSIVYGQRHDREIGAAQAVTNALELSDRQSIHLEEVFKDSDSSLIRISAPMPHESYEELRKQEGPSSTYVPFRNGLMLSTAAAYALQHDAEYIYYGAHMDDGANWAYPDCTPEFNGSMASAIYVGTYHKVRLITPLQWMDKAGVIKLGLQLKAPLHLTYSCYEGRKLHCGKCPTCVNRIQAFIQSGVPDITVYEKE